MTRHKPRPRSCASRKSAKSRRARSYRSGAGKRVRFVVDSLGLKWKEVGATRPVSGDELTNPELSKALKRQKEFTKDKFDTFGVDWLSASDFIRVGDMYFQPAVDSPDPDEEVRHQYPLITTRSQKKKKNPEENPKNQEAALKSHEKAVKFKEEIDEITQEDILKDAAYTIRQYVLFSFRKQGLPKPDPATLNGLIGHYIAKLKAKPGVTEGQPWSVEDIIGAFRSDEVLKNALGL